MLTISTCEEIGGSATYDTDLVIYDPSFVAADVCDDLAGALLACNDDDPLNACGTQDPFHSRIEVPVVQGRQYLIRVGGWGGIGDGIDVGTGELFVDCAATDDDECAFATPIAVGGTVQLDTCSATVDDLAPACGITPPDEPGRWVVVTGTGNDLTVSLCNLNDGNFPDTRLSVYIGGAGPAVDCSNLRCVDDEPNDNNPNCPFTEELTWCSAAGVQYLVLVHGQGSPGCGLIDVTVEEGGPCSAPAGLALGACCLAGGSCVNDLADVACLAMGGTPFAGDGCPAVACPCEDAGITLQQHAVDFPIDDVVRVCAGGVAGGQLVLPAAHGVGRPALDLRRLRGRAGDLRSGRRTGHRRDADHRVPVRRADSVADLRPGRHDDDDRDRLYDVRRDRRDGGRVPAGPDRGDDDDRDPHGRGLHALGRRGPVPGEHPHPGRQRLRGDPAHLELRAAHRSAA